MAEPKPMPIHTDFIELDAFLKWANLVGSGGEAKQLIQAGQLTVNGVKETRRGRKLVAGDVVALDRQAWRITRAAR